MYLEITNPKTGETLTVDADAINLEELAHLEEENVPLPELKNYIDQLSVSAEVKAMLWEVSGVVMKIGEKVIKIGQKILELLIFLVNKYPNATIGLIVGGLVGMLISSIPIIGWAIGWLVGPLLAALGLAMGFWQDMQDKMLQNQIKDAVHEVFGNLRHVQVAA